MEEKMYRKSGRIVRVPATNKSKINDLISRGFEEITIEKGEIKKVGVIEEKDLKKLNKKISALTKENDELKQRIKELEK